MTKYIEDTGNLDKANKSQYTPLVYYIMPHKGQSLQKIVNDRDRFLSNASIFHLGLQVLNILELIHESGLIYNDLKLDNIMVRFNN